MATLFFLLIQHVTQTKEVHHGLLSCQDMDEHRVQLMRTAAVIWKLSDHFLLLQFLNPSMFAQNEGGVGQL